MKQVILLRSDLDGLTPQEEEHFIKLAARYYEFQIVVKTIQQEIFLPKGLVISLDNRMSNLYRDDVLANRHHFFFTRNQDFNSTVGDLESILSRFPTSERVTIWDTDIFTGNTIKELKKILFRLGYDNINVSATVTRDPSIHYEILDIRDFFVYADPMGYFAGGANVIRHGVRDRIPYWALGRDEGCKAMSLRPDQWNRFVADCIHMNQLFGRGV